MTLVSADRIRETATTAGTGTFNLLGAVANYRSFVTGIGDTNTCYYCIVHRTVAEWEVGLGTVTDGSPDTLSRDTVLSSSTGSKVSFSAGTKDVFVTSSANGLVISGAVANLIVNATVGFEAFSPAADDDMEIFMQPSPGQVGMIAQLAGSDISLYHNVGQSEVNVSSSGIRLKLKDGEGKDIYFSNYPSESVEYYQTETAIYIGSANNQIVCEDVGLVFVWGYGADTAIRKSITLDATKIGLLTGASGGVGAIKLETQGTPTGSEIFIDGIGGVTIHGRGVGVVLSEAAGKLGFFDVATPVVKQTVTGATGDPVVISLLSKLGLYGLITDSHSASPINPNDGVTSVIASTFPRGLVNTGTSGVLTSGTLNLTGIVLYPGQVISSITFWAGTTGATLPTAQWFALFDSARNLLAISADDTTTAWAANAAKKLNMTTPYTIVTGGLYYLGVLVVASVVPTLSGFASTIATGPRNSAPLIEGNSSTGLTNPASCPNPAGALTIVGRYPYAEVS